MTKGRLEAFSDGVIAIIITIMVLELKTPHGTTMADLAPLYPVFLCYLLSFVYIGIYWNNHHHLMHITQKVNGATLWANLHLLFWLSLIPFGTAWMGEHHFAPLPVTLYGVILLCAGAAYFLLARNLTSLHSKTSPLAIAIGNDAKGKLSVVLYLAAILVSFFSSALAIAVYVSVAVIWLIPDRRIEKVLDHSSA